MNRLYLDITNFAFDHVKKCMSEKAMYPIDALAYSLLYSGAYTSMLRDKLSGQLKVLDHQGNVVDRPLTSLTVGTTQTQAVTYIIKIFRKEVGISDELHNMLVILEHVGYRTDIYYRCRDYYVRRGNFPMMYMFDRIDCFIQEYQGNNNTTPQLSLHTFSYILGKCRTYYFDEPPSLFTENADYYMRNVGILGFGQP